MPKWRGQTTASGRSARSSSPIVPFHRTRCLEPDVIPLGVTIHGTCFLLELGCVGVHISVALAGAMIDRCNNIPVLQELLMLILRPVVVHVVVPPRRAQQYRLGRAGTPLRGGAALPQHTWAALVPPADAAFDKLLLLRPRRNPAPTTKLLDKNNIERPVLPFQQKSIDDYRAAQEAQDATTATSDNENPTVSRTTLPTTSQILDVTSSPPPTDHTKDKRLISEVEISSNEDSDSAPAKSPKCPPKKKAKNSMTLGNPDAVDADGFLVDINVQSIDDDGSPGDVDKTQDVKEFFHASFSKEVTGKDGKVKKKLYCKCKLCLNHTGIVADPSTCRQHCELKHAGKYRNWCKKAGFELKLAGDVAAWKLKAKQSQWTIDGHLASIEWLVATDQPISALNHPKFKEMINIAACATNGVKIPGCKAT
ncbi:hypothetical protein BJV74DRAFT_889793 [Russula compacta]|nr:hypothetical protein BJV74DRAFT_889793 [Russula compacta]